MKPKLKTELIRAEYWDCGNPDHRHKTDAVASACIEKRENRAALSTGARKWTKEAYAAVLKHHREGARQCDIARSLGLSATRTRQILDKAERLERAVESTDPLDKLSERTRNCLKSENLYTAEAVRAALADGKINDIPNLGAVSKAEVRRWLDGLPSNAKVSGVPPQD
jgi:hypothetical protein